MSNKKFLIVDILFFIVAAYLVVDCLIEGDVTGVVFRNVSNYCYGYYCN